MNPSFIGVVRTPFGARVCFLISLEAVSAFKLDTGIQFPG